MHPRARWIEHNGKPILLHDYSALSGGKFVDTIKVLTESIVSSNQIDTLLLIDASDSFVDKDVIAEFKKAGTRVKPQVKKIAVVGVNQVQRFFINLINQVSEVDATPFKTIEQAKNWLIE